MNYEQTLKLIEAGFTADEIRKMAEEGTQAPEEPGAEGAKAPEEHKPADGNPGKVEQNPEVKALTAEVGKLTDAVKAMQADNIKNANTGDAKKGVADSVKEHMDAFLKEL